MKHSVTAIALGLAILSTTALMTTPGFARQGADDPAGHVRQSRGTDDGTAHKRRCRGCDDAPGHVRHAATTPVPTTRAAAAAVVATTAAIAAGAAAVTMAARAVAAATTAPITTDVEITDRLRRPLFYRGRLARIACISVPSSR